MDNYVETVNKINIDLYIFCAYNRYIINYGGMKMSKELTKKKNITIYPSTEEILKKLSEKYKLSDSRVIDIAIHKLFNEKKEVL